MIELAANEAGALALSFLLEDLDIPTDEQDYFAILSSQRLGTEWHIVEVGVEGLPDKWVIQVYDNGECDPCYTFISPVSASEQDPDLEDFPESIADRIAAERKSHR